MFERIKEILKKKEKTVESPKEWLKERPAESLTEDLQVMEVKFKKPKKWRIPQLRAVKRFMAGIWVVLSFILSGASFNSAPMFILFVGYFFLIMDYLWKTRHKPEVWGPEHEN